MLPFKKTIGKPKQYCQYVLKDKYDDFINWAFGEDVGECFPFEIFDKWNERHSDIYKLYEDMNFIICLENMMDLYKQIADKPKV